MSKRFNKNYLLILLAVLFLFNSCSKIKSFFNKNGIDKDADKLAEFRAIKLKTSVDLSKSTINYFDVDSIDTSKFQLTEDDSPFKIVDRGPVDELPVEMKRPTIYVMFSHPVVPLAKLGDVMKDSPIMKIEPAINGIYRWYGTKLLSFEPEEKYMPQREYTVTISKDVKSLGGKRLEGEREFKFHTEYLDIADFFIGTDYTNYPDFTLKDVPLDDAKNIFISFTYPVNLKVIEKFIKITSLGKNYKFSLSRPEKKNSVDENFINRSIIINLKEKFNENTDVTVTLTKGAKSEEEYLGRPDEINKTFHTITPFRYNSYDTYSYSFPRSDKADANPVYLEFSHPVDEKSVIGNVKVSFPDVDLKDKIEVWDRVVKISNLSVQYESSYSITLLEGIKDVYGRSLGRDSYVTIDVPAAFSYYYFPNTGSRILEAKYAPKIIYEYQNIYDGVWKVDKIDDPYKEFPENSLAPYDFSNLKRNVKHYEILDLKPWLNSGGKGFVGMSWNFGALQKDGRRPSWAKEDLQLQVTDLGITTRYGYNKVIVLVNSLSTGEPVKDANVILLKGHGIDQMESKTNKEGMAIFKLKANEYIDKFYAFPNKYPQDQMRIRVEKGDDKIEFRPNESHNKYHFGIWSDSNPYYIQMKYAQTFIFTDRGLYKPGETVTFRGIDRDLYLGDYSIYQGNYKLSVRESSYRSKPFYTTSGNTTESGGFYGSFKVPDDADPGYYYIEYEREGVQKSIGFQVANFRRLNFAVQIMAPERDFYNGDTVSMKVKANYLAGGSLGGGSYEYYWTKAPAYFKPKGENWKSYRFGPDKYDYEKHLSSNTGKLNPMGEVTAKQKTEEGIKGLAYNYNLEIRVEDIDRLQVAGRKSLLVHPAEYYIGAKFASGNEGWWSPFVKKGEKVDVDYVVVNPDGNLFESFDKNSMLKLKLYRVDWKIAKQKGVYQRVNVRYERVEELEYETTINLKKSTGKVGITPKEAGSYFIELESIDKNGFSAVTRFNFYSTGSSWVRWHQEGDGDINLIADKGEYKPGENVKLLVQSPLQKGKYLITIEREGIFEEKIIELEGSANIIDIPVKEEYLPIFYVAVSSYSKREAEPPKSYTELDLGKPKGYFGIATIMVSTEPKELTIKIFPSEKVYKPGTEAEVTIRAERDGKPAANTEITFMVADRGVLDLINYHVQNPIEFFYSADKFPLAVMGADSRSLLIDPVTYEMKELPGGGGEDDKMQKRKDFRPTAVFEPYLKTDKNGIVKVKFKLPDTLTTYRCTAVAVNKDLFGIKEDEIMVQNPINVRTALPRRLRVRDTSFAGVIATNLDSKEHEIEVTLESDILKIDGKDKQKVKLPPNSAVEIPFKLLALETGEATLVFTIISDIIKEQLEDKLVIEKPLIKEAFTTTGKAKSGEDETKGIAEEGVIIPSNIAEGYGGFSITLDSTRLVALKESINYLFDYPYGCIEQRTSRLLPLVLFGDKIEAFGLDSKVKDVKSVVERELAYFAKSQNGDGGFPFWPDDGGPSSEYGSLKLAHIVYFAEKKGYKIPNNLDKKRLLDFVESIHNSKYASLYCKLYALYVQSLYGRNVVVRAENYLAMGDKIGLAGYGFVGLSFLQNGKKDRAEDCLKRIKNFIKVGTQSIDIVQTYETRYYFDSDVSELALLLMLYNKIDPSSDFIEKITKTLMDRQKYGYWLNTADTAWALQALSEIFEGEAGKDTDYNALVTIDNKEIVNAQFKGISKESFIKQINFSDKPIDKLKKDTLYPLAFKKDGIGALYYIATIKYALPSEVVPARDEGFSVFTEIVDLEGKKVEGRELKLGETYKMRTIISTSKRRNYVAARVAIPSGAEVLDSSFVTTSNYSDKGGTKRTIGRETVYGDEYDFEDEGYGYIDEGGYYFYSVGPIQKIMDNEVRYFFDDFYAGRQEVEFLFRVTTPGIYPTPPAFVQCMYEEEVFGRGSGRLFVIKDE